MKLEVKMCYSHLMFLLADNEFTNVINRLEFTRPEYEFEGMNGYINTNVTFHVKNLKKFSECFDTWYSLPDDVRSKLYRQLKNNECFTQQD